MGYVEFFNKITAEQNYETYIVASACVAHTIDSQDGIGVNT